MTARDMEVPGNQAGISMINQFSETTLQNPISRLNILSKTLQQLCLNYSTGSRETQTRAHLPIPPSWKTWNPKMRDYQLLSVFSFISKVMSINPFISETDTPKNTPVVTEVAMILLQNPITKPKSSTLFGIQLSSRTIKIQRDLSLVHLCLSSETKPMHS